MAKKQRWVAGDVFSIPLPGEGFGVGQVISPEPNCLNSVLCGFFSATVADENEIREFTPSVEKLISVQLTSRDLLDSGRWNIVKSTDPLSVAGIFPIQELREKKYVGAKVRGSRTMGELIAAYHGLADWDAYFESDYLDRLLIPGVSRPKTVKLGKS